MGTRIKPQQTKADLAKRLSEVEYELNVNRTVMTALFRTPTFYNLFGSMEEEGLKDKKFLPIAKSLEGNLVMLEDGTITNVISKESNEGEGTISSPK